MSTASEILSVEWLSGTQANRRAGVGGYRLRTLAMAGVIRTRIVPGMTPRFHAGDCDAVRESKGGMEAAS